MQNTINNRITELVELLNISANAFALKLGVKSTVIYNIQKDRNKPSFDLIMKIIDTFGVNASWLLEGDGLPLKDSRFDGNKYIKNVNVNFNSDVKVNVNEAANEVRLLNVIQENIRKVNYLYQRLADVRLLLKEQLKYTGEISTKLESDLLHSLARLTAITANADDEVSFGYGYEALDYKGRLEYNTKLEDCIELFTTTFFNNFRDLYNGLRKPYFKELEKEE